MYRPVWCEVGAEMCAPRYSGGDELPGPSLDPLAGQGIGHVGGPEPLHVLSMPHVDAPAAGRARLPGDRGCRRAQLVE